jgi:hypothetical protein
MCDARGVGGLAAKRLLGSIMATKSSQPDSHTPGSEPRRTTEDSRSRAERLQQKVAELSKTFDHIEHTLDEAAAETDKSKD